MRTAAKSNGSAGPAPGGPMPASQPEQLQIPPEKNGDTINYTLQGELLETIHTRFPEIDNYAVRQFNERSRHWQARGSISAALADDDYMIANFGPGQYQLFPRGADNRLLGSKFNYQVGEAPRSQRPSLETPAPAPPVAPVDPAAIQNAQIDMLKAELERNNAMMLRLIDSLRGGSAAPAGPSLTDLVGAVASMQKLMTNSAPPAPAVPFPERMMERAFKILETREASAGSGERSSGGGVLDFLRDVWMEMKPLLNVPATAAPDPATTGPRNLAPIPPAAPAAPADEEVIQVDIGPAIAELKEHCRRERPAGFIASEILKRAQQDDALADILDGLLSQPLETILETDPELQMPGYRTWFEKLYEELKRVWFMDSTGDPAGTGGNTSDTPSNGDPGAKRTT